MRELQVNEIFGPTIQGEGAGAGRHCLFVRLAGCNLECNWCDTAYTWAFTAQKAAKTRSGIQYDKATQSKTMTPLQVVDELKKLWPIEVRPTLIVISGGEPLMQQKALAFLVEELLFCECFVHIETAGTIIPDEEITMRVHQFNVSPKLAHSGNRSTMRYKPHVLKKFAEYTNSWFKFVVREEADLGEVEFMVEECQIDPRRVMVMPEGVQTSTLIETSRAIAEAAISRGYGLSLRSHVFLWNDERGH